MLFLGGFILILKFGSKFCVRFHLISIVIIQIFNNYMTVSTKLKQNLKTIKIIFNDKHTLILRNYKYLPIQLT